MIEVPAVDVADGAELLAILALLVRAHHGHGLGAGVLHELDCKRPKAARPPPHEHDVAFLHRVWRPSEEHPIGGRTGECRRSRLLPRQVLCLREALVSLHQAELGERTPARVVAPHAERFGQARIFSSAYPRVVEIPLPGVHDDAVADLDVRDLCADRVDDAGRIAAADVEFCRLAPAGLCLRDVDGDAARSPYVVEVHPGRHDHHERVVWTDLWDVDDLVLKRILRIAVALRPDGLSVHLLWHLTDRWDFTDLVQVLAHGLTPIRLDCAVPEVLLLERVGVA